MANSEALDIVAAHSKKVPLILNRCIGFDTATFKTQPSHTEVGVGE